MRVHFRFVSLWCLKESSDICFLKGCGFHFIARFYSYLVFWFAMSLAGGLRAEDCGSLLEEEGYWNFNRLANMLFSNQRKPMQSWNFWVFVHLTLVLLSMCLITLPVSSPPESHYSNEINTAWIAIVWKKKGTEKKISKIMLIKKKKAGKNILSFCIR